MTEVTQGRCMAVDKDMRLSNLTTINSLTILKMIKAGKETSKPPAKPREPGEV
jgi:hypothetical protein